MPKENRIAIRLTRDELRLFQLTVQACLEAGGDADIFMPMAMKLKEAEERYKRRYKEVAE